MLIKTTSCDAGVRIDLSCDACDVLFAPRASTPQVVAAISAAAAARGWSVAGPGVSGPHFCPGCAGAEYGSRLVEVAAI